MIEFQAPARPDAVLQRRGIERVQAILDAAEALLSDGGYEAATLKAIGARAGIPIASVYHYFADRHQVDLAILKRHLPALDAAISRALDNPALATLDDAIAAVIDPMVTYFRQHPGCAALWIADQQDATLASAVDEYDEATAEDLWKRAISRGFLADTTPRLVIELAFEAGDRLFDVAFQHSPQGDDAVIDEAKRMIAAYLSTYAP